MFRLLKYIKPMEWLAMAFAVVLIAGQVWLDLKLPDYMYTITLLVKTAGSSQSDIWLNGGYMLLCALSSALLAVLTGYIVAKIASVLAQRLRGKVFGKVQSFSMNEMHKFSTASLITRSTNDITQVQMFYAMGLQVLIKAPILAIWAILKILDKSWQWSVATGVAVGVLLLIIFLLIIFVMPKFKKIQSQIDNLNKVTRENLTGIRVVRAYNAEKFEEGKFENANEDLTKNNLFVNRAMAVLAPGMTIIMSGLSLAIYWIGAYLINGADLASKANLFADMIVFSSYAMMVVMAFVMLTIVLILMPRAIVSARRINEVLHTESSIQEGTISENNNCAGEVEFRHVSFKYDTADEYVLQDISFTAKKGEMVAFIGSTGSGKSTLINLIPRFYDATEGEVLIDKINVRDYTLHNLHNKIGYVPQKATLFTGTLQSNVLFGENDKDNITDEELNKAIQIAQAQDVVNAKEGGLQTRVSQGGNNLSGGQKQRIAIARAVARKPEIYIFDDSFSALDYKTDQKLRVALRKEAKDSTVLIVAQRIGTIKNADKIIVLDQGKMVGCGVHDKLMKECEVYREIALSQLSKEEL